MVLFDIDWTLLNFRRDRAVLRNVIEEFTDDPVLQALDPTGRSDRWIVSQLACASGELPEAPMERYAATYHAQLETALMREASSALPGAREFLNRLTHSDGVTVGVATGNLRANAELKLRHAHLDGYFDPLRGGFGEHSSDRREIVAAAIETCQGLETGRIVLVGDTELDVTAARENSIESVAVATGVYSEAQLSAAGAGAVFADLSDTERVAAAILGGDAR